MRLASPLTIVALAALAAFTAATAPASAQVNCHAAPNPASRANCQRAMVDMYQQQARNHAAIERDLANRMHYVEQAQRHAGNALNRHRDPRVGGAWDLGVAAGAAASEYALRDPRIRNWNNRFYGQ
jgi:Skp family chaperone for outer membrane proteins